MYRLLAEKAQQLGFTHIHVPKNGCYAGSVFVSLWHQGNQPEICDHDGYLHFHSGTVWGPTAQDAKSWTLRACQTLERASLELQAAKTHPKTTLTS